MLGFLNRTVYLLLISGWLWAASDQLALLPVSGIKIDGYLSEDTWKTATKITSLNSYLPEEGRPEVEKTAVLMGYDPDNFYIAFVCFYKSPSKIRATITPREEIFDDDYIAFYLDTFNTGKDAYIFAFNPYGIQADGIRTEHLGTEDFTPDFLFESRGRLFSNGYIVEARIPFSSLNFPDDIVMDWKFAIIRRVQYVTHDLTWPAFTVNSTGWISQFGRLTGIKSIQKGKGMEILPEFSAFRTDKIPDNETNPKDGPILGEAGVNIKFGVSSGLNLDLTYNPDFSQIEADANKIDINRVTPLYYAEKRPFFLEGTEIFKTPIEAFYSRQIADPLAGVKLSGRAGEYSIGFLSAVDEYQGTAEYLEDLAEQQILFDPGLDKTILMDTLVAQYQSKKSINNIFRIKRNIFDNSSIGLLVTDREFEDSYNRVYGLDGSFNFNNNNVLTLQGLFAQSRELNSSKEITAPAFHGDYWYGSDTWSFQLMYNDYAPDFRLQNGYISRTDLLVDGYRDLGAGVYYDLREQRSTIQHFRPYIYYSQTYNYQNEFVEGYFYSFLFFRFNFQTDLTLYYYNFVEQYILSEVFSDLQFKKNNFSLDLSNRSLGWFTPSLSYYFGDEVFYYSWYYKADVPPFLGKVHNGNINFNFKPFSNLGSDFSYNLYHFNDDHRAEPRFEHDFSLIQQIIRAKINYQISRYFAARLILQNTWIDYDNNAFNYLEEGELEANFLLSYTPSPGTVIFLGYNDYQERNTDYDKGWFLKNYRQQQRGFFLKLSYLFKAAL